MAMRFSMGGWLENNAMKPGALLMPSVATDWGSCPGVSPPSRASPPGRADRPVQSIGAIERSPVPVALADKALPITPAVSARRRGAV